MDPGLVYDVGANIGGDTRFYLAKGFRVVAVEADPERVADLRRRFATELANGRLTLVDRAVGPEPGTAQFLVFDKKSVWNGLRNHHTEMQAIQQNAPPCAIEVEVIRFEDVLRQHGVPYALKVDIEGTDTHCIEALRTASSLPRYVSFEIDPVDPDSAPHALATLDELGYRRFKVIHQGFHGLRWCRHEGKPRLHWFNQDASGPFGEDTRGRWHSREQLQHDHPDLGRLRWCDLHAALS